MSSFIGFGRTCGHNENRDGGKRCPQCRKDAREERATRIKWRRQMLKENPDLREHGTYETYSSWGCSCEPCRRAGNEVRYRYRRNGMTPLSEMRLTQRHQPPTQPFGREWLDDNGGVSG